MLGFTPEQICRVGAYVNRNAAGSDYQNIRCPPTPAVTELGSETENGAPPEDGDDGASDYPQSIRK